MAFMAIKEILVGLPRRSGKRYLVSMRILAGSILTRERRPAILLKGKGGSGIARGY